MRALVTGASGFVGRSLIAHLRATDAEIFALTRHQRASELGLQWHTIPGEVNSNEVAKAIVSTAPDVVFHLAGTSNASDLSALYETNVVLAAQIFAACMAMAAPPVVVVAGSAAEYGPLSSDVARAHEGIAPRPNTAYGISKLAQTQHALIAASAGLRVTVARLFNPIGAHMPGSLALGSFADQIAQLGTRGGVLRTGNLDSERDFIDVAEAARILVELSRTERAYGNVVNVCTGEASNLANLTMRLVELAGAPITIEHDERRVGNSTVRRFIGDPSLLNSLGIVARPTDLDAVLASILAAARNRGHM